MTNQELIRSMKETLVRMCHTQAYAMELAHKVKRNKRSLMAETPASKCVYVVNLDRLLNHLRIDL
jgi:hypothetical protein